MISGRRGLRRGQHILGASLAAIGVLACSRTPAEPEPAPAASVASGAEPSGPAVAPLVWEVPGSWTVLDVPRSATSPRKAGYKLPKAGDDKEDAEVNVFFFGTGSQGDPEKNFKEWFGEFDGDVGAQAKRESFEVRGMKVETVEVAGTFKIALGPKIGPKKKAPMQMVKQNFRMVGAVVRTPDRGNWFFKMTGPDETVQAARSGFRATLDSVR